MKDFFQRAKLDRTRGKFLDFTEKYQIFNPEFVEKYPLLKYQKILLSFFTACFFLLVARLFGFSFGFDWPLLLVLFVCLFFILAVWEIRKRRSIVYSEVKKVAGKLEERFVQKRQLAQKRIAGRFPKILSGKITQTVSLIFATGLVFFGWIWRNLIFLGAVLGTMADVFIFKFTSDLLIFVLIFLWILTVRYFKLREKISLVLGLMLLVYSSFILLFKRVAVAEKAAIWAYIFLAVGVVQMIGSTKRGLASKEITND